MASRGRGRPKKTVSAESAEFFKVFLPHLHSQQLMIPPDYLKDFKRTIREKVILKDRGGKKWHIDVKETPDRVFLKKGWENFVSDQSLKVGDFLVFRYDGCYSFVVKILGTHGCKKEALVAGSIAKNTKFKGGSEEEMEEGQASHKRARLHKEDDLLTGNERSENSERPAVQIPDEVTERHNLHLEPEMILRNADGAEWPVGIFTRYGGSTFFGSGWLALQDKNDMGLKDRCKFTFENARSSRTIHVEILRAGTYLSSKRRN